jgi:hypothetical protein
MSLQAEIQEIQSQGVIGDAFIPRVIENFHLRRRPDDFFAFIKQQN